MKRTIIAIAALLCGLMLSAQIVNAETDHARQDMFLTESAVPLEQGKTDVELGLRYRRAEGARGAYDNHFSRTRRPRFHLWDWTAEVTHGLSEDQDVFLSFGFAEIKDRAGGVWSYGPSLGRGLKDVTVGTKYRFFDGDGFDAAYIPALSIPIGRESESGRLGPGKSFWGLSQKLALSGGQEDMFWNADVGYLFPFGEGRHHYSMLMGAEQRKTRGVVEANAGVGFEPVPDIQPIAELNYAREFISHGSDSHFLGATLGGKVFLNDNTRLKVAYQHPLTGRNSSRAHSVLASMGVEF